MSQKAKIRIRYDSRGYIRCNGRLHLDGKSVELWANYHDTIEGAFFDPLDTMSQINRWTSCL